MGEPKAQTDSDLLVCPKCGCQWFDEKVEKKISLPGTYKYDPPFEKIVVPPNTASPSDATAFNDYPYDSLDNVVRARLSCAECFYVIKPDEFERQSEIHAKQEGE